MKKKVLIVDDELEILNTLAEVLALEGFEVEKADSGESAIEKSTNKKFDIVLIDYEIGSMNGYETYKVIKQKCPHIKGVLMTAFLEDAVNNDFLHEGINHCFSKPFSNERLLEVLKSL
jgi:CheY-like chemotaxis protein